MISDAAVIGTIGVSGAKLSQDAQVAHAGVAILDRAKA